jgi:hypothetical protein
MLHIYTEGQFLKNVPLEGLLEEKSKIDFNNLDMTIPEVFKDFYHYVINLNFND